MSARPGCLAKLQGALLALAMLACAPAASGQEAPIKVGILHSRSGAMAISESVLADVISMLIQRQNEKGGLLGRRLQAVTADPASDPASFGMAAEKMLTESKVAVVFGGWTSASRKAMLPVFEKHNGLLFYPVQFEGQESSRNIFYTGAVPNQQIIPALRYLMSKQGGSVKRWVLLGTDYVYPRTANAIVEAFLRDTGVVSEDILVRYVPFTVPSWKDTIRELREFAASGRKTAVISTINGDSNIGFYQELSAQGVTAASIPVMAFSVGERELQLIRPKLLEGHLAAWSYFSSTETPANTAFVRAWREFTGNKEDIVNDPMEAAATAFRMWTQAVTQAGVLDVNAVRQAMYGQRLAAPSGFDVVMQSNHMLSKPAKIARVNDKGVFEVIWRSQGTIGADAWSKYLPETAKLTADWTYPWLCGGCVEPAERD